MRPGEDYKTTMNMNKGIRWLDTHAEAMTSYIAGKGTCGSLGSNESSRGERGSMSLKRSSETGMLEQTMQPYSLRNVYSFRRRRLRGRLRLHYCRLRVFAQAVEHIHSSPSQHKHHQDRSRDLREMRLAAETQIARVTPSLGDIGQFCLT